MRIILELVRFTIIFVVLVTILGGITHLILQSIGVNAERYDWITIVCVLLLVFGIYKHRGWDKVFSKNVLCASVCFILLFTLMLPDMSPTYIHSNVYSHSYGFPFTFLTLYIENGSKFVIPTLFSGGITEWNVSLGIIGNVLFFYFSIIFILNNQTKQSVNKAR